jgi:serine/threonine-protein kinase
MGSILSDPPSPTYIGRYRILAPIGASGMGTVYRAHDTQLNRRVALKVPQFYGPPALQARQAARFQREARAAAQVWHPHVCPIFDIGEHHGQPFVVMALIEGRSLADRIAREGRFEDVGRAVGLAAQLLDALAAVHDHGITHRDLKPGNVLLDGGGRAVLTDFGLALPEDEEGESLTSEGIILGTPHYMAPEQAAGLGRQVGPCTDLYSLGVVLYQMLTGRLPFEGPPLTVLHRIVHEEPSPPRTFRPDLDPGLEAVILRALRKRPEDRYPDARALVAALAPWTGQPPPARAEDSADLEDPPSARPDTEVVTPSRRDELRSGGRMRVLGWLTGGVLVSTAAVFAAQLVSKLVLEDSISEAPTVGEWLVPAVASLVMMGSLGGYGLFLWQKTEAAWQASGADDVGWRPSASWALLLFSFLGALLAGVLWMRSFAHPIPFEQALSLAEAGQIKSVSWTGWTVFGELRDPWSLAAQPLGLRGGKFWVDSSLPAPSIREQVTWWDRTIEACDVKSLKPWEGDVALVAVVAHSVLLMAAVFLPLLHWRALFPALNPVALGGIKDGKRTSPG